MIKASNVSYRYAGGYDALQNIDVEFPRGTISAILGESGSGKTTMLMCMGQFLRPTKGTIALDGKSIYDIPERTFRRSVGIVFQKLYLFPHLSVLGNMILATMRVLGHTRRQARTDALAMLDRLGISRIADSYPLQISGGQAQRAAIARGLLLRPDYMLLDEPTSALDVNTTDEFAEWLLDLQNQTNFIIVTHDTGFAEKVASAGVYLSKGRVMDTGDIQTIIAHVRAGKVVNA